MVATAVWKKSHQTSFPCPTSRAIVHGGRRRLFGIDIDAVNMNQAVRRIFSWIAFPQARCRYVVTPNVDHAVMLDERDDFRRAYNAASLVLADGAPVVLASRLLGKALPERVTGSDLVPALFAAAGADRPLRVFLLGAAAGVARRAAEKIKTRYPGVEVVGTYSPPLGFEHDDSENATILALIAKSSPDVLLVGFGAPKQELWVHRHQDQIRAKVALCIGATIDFLAGERKRAPMWMRRSGLEWLHRLASEPRRLITRYLRDAHLFPLLVWREWRAARAS